MPKPIVILGSGGHASVLAEILLNEGREIVAVVSPEPINDHKPQSNKAQSEHVRQYFVANGYESRK